MPVALIIFEFIPVILAIIAIPNLLSTLRQGRSKNLVLSALAACVILIIAQTGWIQAQLSHNTLAWTLFDKLWTVFNALVMYIFIMWSSKVRGKRQ
jgi:uncharacterized membrane protein